MRQNLPHYYEINLVPFEKMLDLRYLQNSYKLYWFAGILEEIKRNNKTITFRKIVSWMVAKSWYSILKYKLHFGRLDRLYEIVEYIFENTELKIDSKEIEIVEYIEKSTSSQLTELIEWFYSYVPYRLLSPYLLDDIRSLPDSKKNNIILEKSNSDPDVLYRIDDENQQIIMNDKWLLYIMHNQAVIDDWLSYKLIDFLQRRNPNVPAIINKLHAPRKRDHEAAKRFWKKINEKTTLLDIYSHVKLDSDDFSIDHFVPWSFVLHDQLWNLVPTTRSINSSKSDRLPDYDTYMDAFCNLQYSAFKTAMDLDMTQKVIEDYLTLGTVELKKDFPRQAFFDAIHDSVYPLYTLARNQGFETWKYTV
jgi:hypothetical protein